MMRMLRAVLIGCMFMVGLIVVLTTLTSTPTTTPTALHSLFTQTHHHLSHLNSLKRELDGSIPLDSKLLIELGFEDPPILYPRFLWNNLSSPVITTAVDSNTLSLVEEILAVAQQIASNATLIIYGLDLSYYQYSELENLCNTSCIATKFNFTPYPSHLKDLRLHAYRPIIIQELLVRAGAVLWLDPEIRIKLPRTSPSTSLSHDNVVASHDYDITNSLDDNFTSMPAGSNLLSLWSALALKTNGVRTWPLIHSAHHLPTSAHTHPGMFKAFYTDNSLYDFQQMSDGGVLLLFNTLKVHNQLMKPWVTCVLTQSCVSPVGAQDSGCRYDKKPIFRYTGCHLYDTSAFNIALGLMFGPDTTPYLSTNSLFTRTPDSVNEEVNEELYPRTTKVTFRDFQNHSANIYSHNRPGGRKNSKFVLQHMPFLYKNKQHKNNRTRISNNTLSNKSNITNDKESFGHKIKMHVLQQKKSQINSKDMLSSSKYVDKSS